MEPYNDILQKIEKELNEFEAKKFNLIEELRKEFPNLLLPLMKKSDKIKSISWTQYTPYFNDGDECIFGVYLDNLDLNDEGYEDDNELLSEFLYIKLDTEEKLKEHLEISKEKNYTWGLSKKLGDHGHCYNPNFDENVHNILNLIKNILSKIPDSFMKDLFGDHVRITITNTGEISVNEYSHD